MEKRSSRRVGKLAEVSPPERSGGGLTSAAALAVPPTGPDPEVSSRPFRRQFTRDYKLSILKQADACRESGQIGALLRREGLYSAHLTAWRRQRDEGALVGEGRRRGRQAHPAESAPARTGAGESAAAGPGEGPPGDRSPKKTCGRPGNPPLGLAARRERAVRAAREAAPALGVVPACAALGLSRATFYRQTLRPEGAFIGDSGHTGACSAAPGPGRGRTWQGVA